MNGPEHYREAERLLGRMQTADDGELGWMSRAQMAAEAQVHATLALAAAAALNDPQGGMGGNDWHAWHDAVSVDAMKVSEGQV
jgi:trans-2-enoyl-CoA reductase